MRRPVFLFGTQYARKQRQHKVRGVLGIKQRIRALWEPQFPSQFVDWLGPLTGAKTRQAFDHAPEAGNLVGPRQPGIGGSTGGSNAEKNESGAST